MIFIATICFVVLSILRREICCFVVSQECADIQSGLIITNKATVQCVSNYFIIKEIEKNEPLPIIWLTLVP